jgi:hypothetical protein
MESAIYYPPISLDINSISDDIDFLFAKVDGWFIDKDNSRFHRNLQLSIKDLAKRYGLKGKIEFPVRDRGDGRGGAIDIAWLDSLANPRVLIEIDSSFRKKSLFKLRSVPSDLKIWIYYGKIGHPAFTRFSLITDIFVLYKCRRFE